MVDLGVKLYLLLISNPRNTEAMFLYQSPSAFLPTVKNAFACDPS